MSKMFWAVLGFYAFWESPLGSGKDKYSQLIIFAILGGLASVPAFLAGHWILGVLGVLAVLMLNWPVYNMLMYISSYLAQDGRRCVGPSEVSVNQLLSSFVALGSSSVVFLFFCTTYFPDLLS
jgi:hypothetical protein